MQRRRQSINYWIHALSSSLAKGAMQYYGRKFGLRLPEMRILSTLGSRGPLAARDLVTWTAMDKAMVSRVLSGLAADGYVVQSDSESRARMRPWALSPLGAELVERLRPEWQAREARLQKDLSAEEREQLVDMLERLFWASEKLAGEDGHALRRESSARTARARRSGSAAGLADQR